MGISHLAGACLKISSGNTRTMSEIYSKLTIMIPEQHHRRSCGVFIFKFEQVLRNVRLYLLIILNKKMLGQIKCINIILVNIIKYIVICYISRNGVMV